MVLLEVIALKDLFSDYVKIGIGTSGIGKMIVAVVAMLGIPACVLCKVCVVFFTMLW